MYKVIGTYIRDNCIYRNDLADELFKHTNWCSDGSLFWDHDKTFLISEVEDCMYRIEVLENE